ncbi:hypothetical protein GOP47_0024298 [Adiantum capillus-veneris]|uniref:GAGA-binding transcriptional activator n=1 Tax=Adiantum capillus-veneris TaxID=13818 RepID=A0A9D4U1V9_ADICA|nr:hypothetical protein GOP47_0024298 [Adiantum capillus-veneris]
MDDPGRMGVHPWPNFDLKHNLREHPALKLMDMVQEREAAIAERDTALVEKKTAFAERESAYLQRDVAVADRNAAWMERDAAVMALSMVRAGKDYREVAAKLMQMVNMAAVPMPIMEANLQGFSKPGQESDQQGKQPGKKASPKKRKFSVVPIQNAKSGPKSPSKKRKQKVEQGAVAKTDKRRTDEDMSNNCDALVPFYTAGVTPIPYCSCTGANQQCYRWGRKMSGSAFKKLLERLAADGVDISVSIDLKNYWAKHGTNRYATIK